MARREKKCNSIICRCQRSFFSFFTIYLFSCIYVCIYILKSIRRKALVEGKITVNRKCGRWKRRTYMYMIYIGSAVNILCIYRAYTRNMVVAFESFPSFPISLINIILIRTYSNMFVVLTDILLCAATSPTNQSRTSSRISYTRIARTST